jgi:hypothetical protein
LLRLIPEEVACGTFSLAASERLFIGKGGRNENQ